MDKVVAMFFAVACCLSAIEPVPPGNPAKIGCSLMRSSLADKTSWWHVYVTAEYENAGKWRKLYSVRSGDETSRAMKDCQQWIRSQQKQINKSQ